MNASDEAKSGQFTLQLQKELILSQDSEETTASVAKFPGMARMSFEEREEFEKKVSVIQKAIQS